MNKDDFYYLGKILKPFGNKGQVAAMLDVDEPARYMKLESVYLDLDPERVPFFIQSIEMSGARRVVIKFEDVDSIGDAEPYSGKEMYLLLSSLPPLKGKKFYYHEVMGFSVIDEHHGAIGTLTKVLELPRQPLLQIDNGGKEILVPLVDEVILKVDRKKKELHIRAPEGLIEFYL
ncbi:MAG: ribosome maturation factor RimM [Bacteroidetes bacterium]|nr:ribosome maturation factor RimM [Bacteroidota bacterium]